MTHNYHRGLICDVKPNT